MRRTAPPAVTSASPTRTASTTPGAPSDSRPARTLLPPMHPGRRLSLPLPSSFGRDFVRQSAFDYKLRAPLRVAPSSRGSIRTSNGWPLSPGPFAPARDPAGPSTHPALHGPRFPLRPQRIDPLSTAPGQHAASTGCTTLLSAPHRLGPARGLFMMHHVPPYTSDSRSGPALPPTRLGHVTSLPMQP